MLGNDAGRDRKQLLRKVGAPPPSATTVMLQSMLGETRQLSTKKPKKKLAKTNETCENTQTSMWSSAGNLHASNRRVLSVGGLSDAPNLFRRGPSTTKPIGVQSQVSIMRQKMEDNENKTLGILSANLKVGSNDFQGTKEESIDTVASTDANVALTLHIALTKKRPRGNRSLMTCPLQGEKADGLNSPTSERTNTPSLTLVAQDGRIRTGALNRYNNLVVTPAAETILISRHDNRNKVPNELLLIRGNGDAVETFLEKSLVLVESQSTSVKQFQKDDATMQASVDMKVSQLKAPAKRVINNDNFVRLNLRNSAGACRGARNKKTRKRFVKPTGDPLQAENHNDSDSVTQKRVKSRAPALRAGQSGLDPLDDYLDGVYNPIPNQGKVTKKVAVEGLTSEKVPNCARHQRPCKLLVVKKNTTGNKGRKFYVCSLPRGEQCTHFEWADNTIEAAQRALMKNSSYSGFVARQVAAHTERFRSLTVPELREETKRRKINSSGKKQQLITRLSLWVRDEVAKVAGETDAESFLTTEGGRELPHRESNMIDPDKLDSDDASTSSEELEVCRLYQATPPAWLGNEDASADDDSMDDKSDADPHARPDDTSTSSSLETNMRSLFGYKQFRDGQEWAIERCLEHKRTLLVAPTGFGKSLCYALPAALMDGVCIVVSPLISLMQDQLRQLPPRIPAATLSGSMPAATMASIIDDVIRGRVKVLFVSPERLASASFRRLFRMRWNPSTNTSERLFPTVSLLCVDEAHCMSQWGHNFRPCYLRLRSLVGLIQPCSVLAMTATAGILVVKDICETLGISMDDDTSLGGDELERTTLNASSNGQSTRQGLKILKCDRDNIEVRCMVMASEGDRISMLMKMVGKRKANKRESESGAENTKDHDEEGLLAEGSIIVYVWRKMDAEVVAESLIASGIGGGVVVYHGGMDAAARSKAQNKFMRGKARICVATVAFGLGINKIDVRAVIHLYLPSSPENYLQEIGRAGRDGRPARAIALVLRDEVVVRYSLSHSNLLSKSQVKSLLVMIQKLVNESADKIHGSHSGIHASNEFPLHIALPMEASVMVTDCKSETIETVLSLIEDTDLVHPLLRVEGIIFDNVTVTLKRRSLQKLAMHEQVARCIEKCSVCLDSPDSKQLKDLDDVQDEQHSRQQEFIAYSFGSYQFSVSRCSGLLGPSAEPRHVFAALRRLQNDGELELLFDSSAGGKALHIVIQPRGVDFFSGYDSPLDAMAATLAKQFASNVFSVAEKALVANDILLRVATVDSKKFPESPKSASLRLFQHLVTKYFAGEDLTDVTVTSEELPVFVQDTSSKQILVDCLQLLRDLASSEKFQPNPKYESVQLNRVDFHDYTSLMLVKFFHGIDSPRAPNSLFNRHMLFGKWRTVKFMSLLNIVQDILHGIHLDR